MQAKSLPRILPFAVFMGFIGIEGLLRSQETLTMNDSTQLYLYPIRVFCVVLALLFFRREYSEITWSDLRKGRDTLLSIVAGLLIFVLWINLDFSFATQGEPTGYNPLLIEDGLTRYSLIAIRIAGASLLVPVMEELFWRSFLIRYAINSDFGVVRIGSYTLTSFLITSVLFGLEHHYILAGIVAGVIFNLLLYKTRSISQCILSHAVANFALAIYVLCSEEWRFW